MASDTSETFDRLRSRAEDACSDNGGSASVASHQGAQAADEGDREEWYQKAVKALMDRTCRLAAEADSDAVPVATSDEASKIVSVPDTSNAPAGRGSPGDAPRVPHRVVPKETAASIEAFREVAKTSARQAIGLHSFRGLFSSACRKLSLAALALAASCVAQALATPRFSSAALAVALVAWVAGAYWTAQYFSVTRELSRHDLSTLSAEE